MGRSLHLVALGGQMRLVVGLGNPGEAYAGTRHNLGFRVVEEFARRHGLALRPAAGGYALAEGLLAGEPLVLLEPLTFMNRSGEPLRAWAERAGVALGGAPPVEAPAADSSPEAKVTVVPIVVCDDIALPLGALRVRARGSAGGHRGLDAIIAAVGGEEFPRLRLGVADVAGPPEPAVWAEYVLAPFSPAEEPVAEELVARAADALETALLDGPAAAAARFNTRPAVPDGDAG